LAVISPNTWSSFVPEQLPVALLLKRSRIFYETRRFSHVLIRACHRLLSLPCRIPSIWKTTISRKSTLILYSQLYLCGTSSHFPSGLPSHCSVNCSITSPSQIRRDFVLQWPKFQMLFKIFMSFDLP
jgi:hypothetical protein